VLLLLSMQLKLLQDAIRREEEFLAEQRRAEIQARAEADEAAKMAYYQAKQEEREQRLEQVRSCLGRCLVHVQAGCSSPAP
jgi:hypothetical protein